MKLILAVPSLDPQTGGPASMVPAIGERLQARGIEVSYLTADGVDVPRSAHADVDRPFDLVANFGTWSPHNHRVSRAAARAGRPVVSCPMGMLEPWPMQQKWVKKRVAWLAYQKRDLQYSKALHATGDTEAAALRALGLRPPIFVIPHGTDLPSESELIRLRASAPAGNLRTALFLSRIHPKKGIADLIGAWGNLKPVGWRLLIAGPDPDKLVPGIHRLIKTTGDTNVEVAGPIFGDAKAVLMANADLFVLPSYSENFGLVVAEALAHGTPVVTTTATPWSELPARHCGWYVDPGESALTLALREATSLSRPALAGMGENGRRLIHERCSWPVVIDAHLSLYRWAAFGGPPPSSLGEALRPSPSTIA